MSELHPFYAVADLAKAQGMDDLLLVVERDGKYVRLTTSKSVVLFKSDLDEHDSIDRIGFSYSKRIDLPETLMREGPSAILLTIRNHILEQTDKVKRAASRTKKPTLGRIS